MHVGVIRQQAWLTVLLATCSTGTVEAESVGGKARMAAQDKSSKAGANGEPVSVVAVQEPLSTTALVLVEEEVQ